MYLMTWIEYDDLAEFVAIDLQRGMFSSLRSLYHDDYPIDERMFRYLRKNASDVNWMLPNEVIEYYRYQASELNYELLNFFDIGHEDFMSGDSHLIDLRLLDVYLSDYVPLSGKRDDMFSPSDFYNEFRLFIGLKTIIDSMLEAVGARIVKTDESGTYELMLKGMRNKVDCMMRADKGLYDWLVSEHLNKDVV